MMNIDTMICYRAIRGIEALKNNGLGAKMAGATNVIMVRKLPDVRRIHRLQAASRLLKRFHFFNNLIDPSRFKTFARPKKSWFRDENRPALALRLPNRIFYIDLPLYDREAGAQE